MSRKRTPTRAPRGAEVHMEADRRHVLRFSLAVEPAHDVLSCARVRSARLSDVVSPPSRNKA